jgi:hypothetical protein
MADQQIYETSPFTISALTLVNKTFYESARYLRDRKQNFYLEGTDDTDFCTGSAARIKAFISGPSSNTRCIRHIMISSPFIGTGRPTLPSLRNHILNLVPVVRDTPPSDLKWHPISQLIAKTQTLRSFTFGAYEKIPLSITETLQKYHPKAELHIRNWTRTR